MDGGVGLAAAGLQEFGDGPGPAGLVGRAEPAAGVAVEILVEEEVIPKMGVGLEFLVLAEYGAPAVGVPKK